MNAEVENVTINKTSEAGIHLFHCYLSKIAGSRITDSTSFESAHGLGISLNRSYFCLIQNNTLTNHRHGILLDHGNSNCLIQGNQVSDCKTSGSIDLHGEYNLWNVIRENEIANGKTGIVVGGGGDVHYNDGPLNCIAGNTILKCNVGIEIRNEIEQTILGKNTFEAVKEEVLFTNILDNLMIRL